MSIIVPRYDFLMKKVFLQTIFSLEEHESFHILKIKIHHLLLELIMKSIDGKTEQETLKVCLRKATPVNDEKPFNNEVIYSLCICIFV